MATFRFFENIAIIPLYYAVLLRYSATMRNEKTGFDSRLCRNPKKTQSMRHSAQTYQNRYMSFDNRAAGEGMRRHQNGVRRLVEVMNNGLGGAVFW
jgi:hypothetical protein